VAQKVSLARVHVLHPAPEPARSERLEPKEQIELQVSDTELVERLGQGDQWAKEALYRRYVRVVWSTALRLMGSRADAEDVVQDTFAEALRDLSLLRKPEALRPWLLQIVVHQAHRRFRRRSILRRLGLDRGTPDATLAALAHHGASSDVRAELALVDRALARVSTEERFAWILRYVEGHSLEEVAAACGCSLATIKRRIGKASACVERHLGQQTPTEKEAPHD
jgi:RNA polymerase sigma-70 factor (ECF subfamily)